MAKRIPVLGTVALAFFFIVALMLANSQAMAGEATTVTETTPPPPAQTVTETTPAPPAQTVTETTPAPSSGSGSGSGSNSGSKSGSTSTKAPRRKVVVVTHTVRVPAETNDTAVAQGGIQAGGGGMAATGLSGLQLLALGSGALALILALSAGGLTVRRRSVEL